MPTPCQDVFAEKSNAIAEQDFAIVPRSEPGYMSMRAQKSLADYVLRVMKDNSLTFPEVERIARKRGGTIGKSTIQQIAMGKTPNPGVFTLQELAWGLQRPVEEVINAALGTPLAENYTFLKSELAELWDSSKHLPVGEQRVFKRFVEMCKYEVRRILGREDA